MDINNGIGYTITLDNKQVQQILRQTKQDFESFNTHVQNQFTQTTGVVNTLAKGVAAFLTVDYATQFVSQMVKVRGEFEQLEIAFTTMLGSKEKADSLMQEIVTFAATTPFGLQSTSEATKMLLAYGESAETALDTMRKLGDIASGVGIPLKDIAYLYGTTMTQGRLYTQDLNQFLGRGIPMMDELAKTLGVSKNEVKGLVEAGKVGFPEVQKVIDNLTASGSMFGGLMEAQSKSVAGQIEQLKDAVDVMFNEIGKDSQGFVTSIISGASSVVENYEAIGKTIAGLIAVYGSYKAAVIAFGVAQRIVASSSTATVYLEMSRNLGTLTAAHRARAVAMGIEAAAQRALNAVTMVNPYVMVAVAIGTVVSAYYLLRDSTDAAVKAQEDFNTMQGEFKSKLDETKQKAEEYISILKDETATVYQQIEAYKALQLLKLKGLENITQEQIATMDLTELRKLLNIAYDDNSLQSQEQELKRLQTEINGKKNEILQLNETSFYTKNKLEKQVEALNVQYDLQKDKVAQIKQEQMLANLPLKDRAKYWEDEVNRIQGVINEIEKTNSKHLESKNILGTNVELSSIFKATLNAVNINPLLIQLDEAKKQFSAINAEMGTASAPEVKDKAYYEKYQKQAQDTLYGLDLNDPKNAEKIKALRTIIEGTTNALKKYNTVAQKTSTPKIGKPTKKSDDPVEIYKKQVSEIEKQHERYLKILDSNDISFITEKAILQAQLSSKGKTYEEYLRTQQKELSKTAETSEITRKKLSFVNDELLKLINHSEVEIFKDNLDKQLDNVDSVVEKLKIIDDVKNELSSNTNELTALKIEFIDKTQLELLEQLDKSGKDLVASLGGGYSQLQKLTNEYNNDILILTESLKNAKTEAEKTVINDSIWKRGVKFAEDSKDLPTNDDNYNKLLLEFKSFEQKKADITLDFDNKIAVAKLNNDKKLEEQLLQEKKKALSKIALEQMKSSESFVKLLGDLDKMSVKSLDKLIKEIESQLDNPEIGLEMSAEDINIILDQLQKAKDEISKKNPFKAIQEGWNDFWNATTDDDKLEALDKFMSGVNSAFEATKEIMDMTTDAVEAFGGKLDDSAKQTIQSVQNIVNGIGNAIQGYFSGDWAQMVAGIVQVVVEVAKLIGGSKDKRLEKRIKKQQQAVNDLKRAYDDLSFAIDRALGGKNYSLQQDQIKNLQEQKILMEQMIKNEEKKKKTDKNKVNEWKNAIADIDRQIQEIQENIASDILQTTAKELANELGDALAEAFGKGEDAAKSFEKVANDVLKNAVLNQLKKEFLEKQLQGALDKLKKDMGGDDEGNFSWNQLTPEEQQEFRDKIKEISKNYLEGLEMYSELFSDLVDPNEDSLAGAIKGVSEETASLIAGQVNAMRLLIVEANKTRIETNRILLQSLDRLANIDYNTRSVLPLLEKLINRIDNAGRAYGF